MAEERIVIHRCSNQCRCLREISGGCDMVKEECMSNGTYCTAYIHGQWQKIDPEKDCKNCERAEYDGISRAEAIERMANAMWKSDNKDLPTSYWETQMKEAKNRYLQRAEAALDALIEANKNE